MGASQTSDNGAAVQSLEEAHRQLRAQGDIQFDLGLAPPPRPSPFAQWLSEKLSHLAPYADLIFWAALALGGAIILWLVARRLVGMRRSRNAHAAPEETLDAWRPEERAARALLAEADAMAAAGRFEEAARLLLHRSIEDIQRNRPRFLRPALTSRDIARAEALPQLVREAFRAMALPVERSLFAGRALERRDWDEARAAYGAFALPKVWK